MQQLIQGGQFCCVPRHRQLADAPKAKMQLLRQFIPQLIAFPFETTFEGVGGGMMSAVNDAAVGFRRTEADLDFALA